MPLIFDEYLSLWMQMQEILIVALEINFEITLLEF